MIMLNLSNVTNKSRFTIPSEPLGRIVHSLYHFYATKFFSIYRAVYIVMSDSLKPDNNITYICFLFLPQCVSVCPCVCLSVCLSVSICLSV